MSFETNETNETIDNITEQNIKDAIKFAENNSTVVNLPPQEFDEYNESGLLQRELPEEFHEKLSVQKRNKILELEIQISNLEGIIKKSTNSGLKEDLKRSIESIRYQINTIKKSEGNISKI